MPYTGLLLLVGFVPLLLAVEQIMRGNYSHKGRKVFWTAFLTGFVWNTASIYWVFNAMNAFLPTAVSLLIALIPFGLAPLLPASAEMFSTPSIPDAKQHVLKACNAVFLPVLL